MVEKSSAPFGYRKAALNKFPQSSEENSIFAKQGKRTVTSPNTVGASETKCLSHTTHKNQFPAGPYSEM